MLISAYIILSLFCKQTYTKIKTVVMKKGILLSLVLSLSIPVLVSAQSETEKVKKEISKTLESFYSAAQKASTEEIISLFDTSPNIMFIGGDSAEIWKGADKIRGHLNSMFPDVKVTLLMERTDIDYNQNTAWVFADGRIIITPPEGEPMKAPYRFMAILVKKANFWKFTIYNGQNPGSK